MKISVIGFMKSHLDPVDIGVCNENMPQVLENLKRFAGAEGGICYMSKPYFDSYVTDPEKALKRFTTVAATGHHSIAGHSQVALLFEGVPKIIAMFLNNLNDYETSEKSGRYTVMTGNTDVEMEVYTKWCEKLQTVIKDTYGDKIDDRTVDKLAKENARYFLSIFTPTTMGYTTSIRQFNYIIDWAERYAVMETPNNYFFTMLKKYFADLAVELKEILYVAELRDFKNRQGFDMIDFVNTDEVTEQFGKFYTVGYMGTFAEFAQAQRHRTLFYNMQFDGISDTYYVPPIIRGSELENEWMEDMKKVAEYVPTGTMVYTEESGSLNNFYLKSMERNCGRAQLEIMQQNIATGEYFVENLDKFPKKYQEVIKKNTIKGCPKMKGQTLACKEPCVWGCQGAKDRLI